MTQKQIVLMGGTYDPIHLGHTIVAEEAVRHIGADELIFVPAKLSPLKKNLPNVSDNDRFNMVSLAISGEKNTSASSYELEKPAPSFTLQTVKHFFEKYGSDIQLYWLIGADGIDELIHWYKITELIDICNLATMYRAGHKQPDFNKFKTVWGIGRIEKLQRNIIPTSLVDISSTEIRHRLNLGQDVSQMLNPQVLRYIQIHNLYQRKQEDYR